MCVNALGLQRTTLDAPPLGLFIFVLMGDRMEDRSSLSRVSGHYGPENCQTYVCSA